MKARTFVTGFFYVDKPRPPPTTATVVAFPHPRKQIFDRIF